MLQNGRYAARLSYATAYTTAAGARAVEFLWELDNPYDANNPKASAKSTLVMTKRDGTPNDAGIQYVRNWATDWDGKDPEWFARNLAFVSLYRIAVTIEDGKVKWVTARNYWEKTQRQASAAPAPCGVPFFDPAKLKELPRKIERTMSGVWCAFRFLAEGKTPDVRDRKWFELIASAAPGKMQVDFTEEDWQKVIDEMLSA